MPKLSRVPNGLRPVSLNDVWEKESGPVFMNGSQALARLPLLQAQLDRRNNLNTAGLISGYRGSPLRGFDKVLWKARDYPKTHHIQFLPGITEDVGPTAVWSSQK